MWIQCQRHLICNNTYADLKEKIFKNRHEYRKKCKHMIVLIFNLLLSVIIKNMLISDISCTVKGFYLYFVTEYIQKIPTYLKPQGTLGGCQFSASQSEFYFRGNLFIINKYMNKNNKYNNIFIYYKV